MTTSILRVPSLRRLSTGTRRSFTTSIASRSTTTLLSSSAPFRRVLNSQSLRPPLNLGRRHLTTEQRAEIQKAIDAHPVVLFMKGTVDAPQCGFSRAVVQILDLQQVPVESLKTFNVLNSQELRDGIKEFSDWPTIPQLYVKGEFVGGCDIILAMHQSGELETLLENKGVIPKVEAPAS
ncbi:thioredoxin-like protein [Flagelloscypha sp. PMI_526]|nr:thioredoxin-like protein [Flagelloscypha sp. PMI_526]